METYPEVDNFDLNNEKPYDDAKQCLIDIDFEHSTKDDTNGQIGFESLGIEDFYKAYQERAENQNFPRVFQQESDIESENNFGASPTQNFHSELEMENEETEEVPYIDKKSKKISKAKNVATSSSKKSDCKKDDPKKNAPGLHRDRALKCSKDLLKTLKKENTLSVLEANFDKFDVPSKKRFEFLMNIFRRNASHFSEYVRFVDYMKRKFQPDWKDNKTWAKLNEFCTIREYQNAGKIFKQIMVAIIERDDNSEIDIWMSKFRGNENTKEYITSTLYQKDFELHVNIKQ